MSLSKFFKPNFNYELNRIGKNNDGGYLVDTESVKNAEFLISLGISDDWSFEEDFFLKKDKKISVECFDDRLNEKFLIKNMMIQFVFILYHRKIRYFIDWVSKYFSYKRVKKIFHFKKKKISYGDLDKIVRNKNKNVFLKIDIESGEYRILDDILDNKDKLVGLVLEFHDCDLHKDKIINFIKTIDLTLVHIHGNNYSDLDLNGDPTALELSFARFPIKKKQLQSFPNILDMPNNKDRDEVLLKFENY
jgi:hypothetical protein